MQLSSYGDHGLSAYPPPVSDLHWDFICLSRVDFSHCSALLKLIIKIPDRLALILWVGTSEGQGLAEVPQPGSPFLWEPHCHGVPELAGGKAAQ